MKRDYRVLVPSFIVFCMLVLYSAVVAPTAAYAQKLTNEDRAFRFVTCPSNNSIPDPDQHCFTFDRIKNQINNEPYDLIDPLTKGIVATIVASKIIFSGTVLRVDAGEDNDGEKRDCSKYMWYVVTQTNESSSVLIYNPTDVGAEYCDYATPNVGSGTTNYVYIPLPVHVVWAEMIGYKIVRADNFHKAPSPIVTAANPNPSFTNCDPNAAAPEQTLELCDRDVRPASWFYKTGSTYNVLTQPGTGSGAISYTPVIGNTAASYAFDVQVNPSFRVNRSMHSVGTDGLVCPSFLRRVERKAEIWTR